MDICPQIGHRVSFAGSTLVGPCVGVVTAIYPTYDWDDDYLIERGVRPESDWQVCFHPDVLPTPWCYSDQDSFAPSVSDLSPVVAP